LLYLGLEEATTERSGTRFAFRYQLPLSLSFITDKKKHIRNISRSIWRGKIYFSRSEGGVFLSLCSTSRKDIFKRYIEGRGQASRFSKWIALRAILPT